MPMIVEVDTKLDTQKILHIEHFCLLTSTNKEQANLLDKGLCIGGGVEGSQMGFSGPVNSATFLTFLCSTTASCHKCFPQQFPAASSVEHKLSPPAVLTLRQQHQILQ